MLKKLDKGKLKYFYKETASKSYNFNNSGISSIFTGFYQRLINWSILFL